MDVRLERLLRQIGDLAVLPLLSLLSLLEGLALLLLLLRLRPAHYCLALLANNRVLLAVWTLSMEYTLLTFQRLQ